MQQFINQKVLITASGWFYGPDGRQYRAAWGTLKAIHEAGKTLGFIPNRSHANWFVEIGSMVIMGCQVLYIMRCDQKPNDGFAKDHSAEAGILREFERPSHILVLE
jgi:hypothetical protein